MLLDIGLAIGSDLDRPPLAINPDDHSRYMMGVHLGSGPIVNLIAKH